MFLSLAVSRVSGASDVANQAHKQAALDAQSGIGPIAVIDAVLRNDAATRGYFTSSGHLYRDTPERAKWRTLINAAVAMPGVVVVITYVKKAGELRTILAQPYEVNADQTKRYATLWDVEAGDYRRVNLDSIIKLTLETHSIPCQCPRAEGYMPSTQDHTAKLNHAAALNS